MESKIIAIRVNDEAILKHLENQENRNQYLLSLVRDDMANIGDKNKIRYMDKWLDAIIELSAPFPEEQKAYKNCKEKIKEVQAL